ncbi:unnamed protein product, partial [Closterium sp. NIES-53]
LSARFEQDLQVLRLHSDRGGEFSSGLLWDFYREEGITQLVTLPASPQQNGIDERRIGLVMELNLWPSVSVPETSPTLRWTGEVGDASAFWVRGALSLVRDGSAGKLSPRTLHCVFLSFPTDAPPWAVLPPCLASHPHRTSPLMSPPPVDPLYPQGPAPSGVSQVDPPPLVEPLEVSSDTSRPAEGGEPAADDTAATRCSPRVETPLGFPPRPSSLPPLPITVYSGAAEDGDTGGADSRGASPEVADSRGVESGGAGSGGAGSGGADTGGAASPSGGGVVGAPAGAWSTGAGGAAGVGAAGAGGTGAAGAGGTGAAGAGGARARGTGAAGARGAGAVEINERE